MSRYGEALAERREVRGFLTASDLAAKSKAVAAELNDPQFQAFSQQTLSRLESDRSGEFIANARPRIQRMLSCLLGWTADEFAAHVGITIPEVPWVLGKNGRLVEASPQAAPESASSRGLSAAAKGYRVPRQELPPIPDSLLEAAEIFGGSPEFAGLREYRWQHWMTITPHKHQPTTPAEWLDFYVSVKDRVDPKEPGN